MTTNEPTPPSHDRRMEDRYVTKDKHYLALGGTISIVVAVIAVLFNIARSGAEDAAARPVAELGARVTITEQRLGGLEEQVKALDVKLDGRTATIEQLVRDTERSWKAGLEGTNSKLDALLIRLPAPSPPPPERR